MKMHGKVNGSAWLPSLLAIVVLTLLLLVVFGATPSEILQMPQAFFNTFKPASAPRTAAADATDSENGSPAPDSSAAATPRPSPTPPPYVFDLKALSSSPSQWPPTVALKADMDFPSIHGDRHATAGTQVKLLSIMGQNLTVEFNGADGIVPADGTDLKERVMAAHAHAAGN